MNKNEKIIIFLNKCGIVLCDIDQLDGFIIERSVLLSEERYNNIIQDIPDLKTYNSSSILTALQSKAKETQKWPLINIVRQLLKTIDYNLKPIRKSDGYLNNKKKYKRFFFIEKIST